MRGRRNVLTPAPARPNCTDEACGYWPGTQSRPLRWAGPGSPGLAGGGVLRRRGSGSPPDGGPDPPSARTIARSGPSSGPGPPSGSGSAPVGASGPPGPGPLRRSSRTPAAAGRGRRGSAPICCGRALLEQRQQRPDRLDRQPHLVGVALALRARGQAGAAHAEVDQRHHVLEQHVLDADPLDLRLVGGAQLLLGGRALGRSPPIAFDPCSSRHLRRAPSCPAYVRRVSATIAA